MVLFLWVFVGVCWLGFLALSFAVSRRVSPGATRTRSLLVAAASATLLSLPSWVAFGAVLWLQRAVVGRALLARMGFDMRDSFDVMEAPRAFGAGAFA